MDSRRRSVMKALSWRVLATIITTVVSWGVTHDIRFATAIGLLDAAFKLCVYYMHERAWNRLNLGRANIPG